jgi:hypothetical protein
VLGVGEPRRLHEPRREHETDGRFTSQVRDGLRRGERVRAVPRCPGRSGPAGARDLRLLRLARRATSRNSCATPSPSERTPDSGGAGGLRTDAGIAHAASRYSCRIRASLPGTHRAAESKPRADTALSGERVPTGEPLPCRSQPVRPVGRRYRSKAQPGPLTRLRQAEATACCFTRREL